MSHHINCIIYNFNDCENIAISILAINKSIFYDNFDICHVEYQSMTQTRLQATQTLYFHKAT